MLELPAMLILEFALDWPFDTSGKTLAEWHHRD
jgi:hypothetical protein